jgi:phenylpropionate dioxygenase-like ring-hydroxylating dioxygenase large terminal subunit
MKLALPMLLSLIQSQAFYVPVATYATLSKSRAISFEANGFQAFAALNKTGHPVVFADYCPHRGASFDKAPIVEDSISCPYHDFRFHINHGALVSGLGAAPGCSSLVSVPCVQREGLVWACVDGDDSEPPPPTLAESLDPTFRRISGTVKIRCNARALVENVLDNLHISTVHSFGNRAEPTPMHYKARRLDSTHGVASFVYAAGKTSLFNGDLHVKNWYNLPATAGTTVTSGTKSKVVQVHAVQRANGVTEVHWELLRNFMVHPWLDGFFRLAMAVTLDEDKRILETCVPERGDKFHSKYDQLQVLYRHALKQHKLRLGGDSD